MNTTCGYCGGSGRVPGRKHDAYGPRPDYPDEVTCEYCGGPGQCEGGNLLLGHGPAPDVQPTGNEGNPPWG